MPISHKIRSYAITIRPRFGVTDDQVKKFDSWVRKNCDYYYVITEKDDDARHVHAGIFLKKHEILSNLCLRLTRLFKELDHDEKTVMRDGVKRMYNGDFMSSYMAKQDATVVISKNLPEESTLEDYFREVQPPQKKGPSCTDPYYGNLEKLWFQYKRPIEESNPVNLRHFLMRMMNVERVIKVIADNKKIFQLSCALSRYINKCDTWEVDADPFHQDL